ncbi:MAG TPA: hypothetical protein PLY93_01175 [Turneriella sp.]|nr:hypothetical protein [Turneriella sp.]
MRYTRIYFALALLAALWVTFTLLPHEGTLYFAARHKLDFSIAWAYQFRDDLLFSQVDKFMLSLLPFYGGKVWLVGLLLALPLVLSLLWNTPRAALYIALLSSLILWFIFFSIANPLYYFKRLEVMGGSSLRDTLFATAPKDKIPLDENCVYVINPTDVRGISSVEALDKKSIMKQPRLYLLDLKVVEENYALLNLKNEVGTPLFSDAARAYATAEVEYAKKIQKMLFQEKSICLVANFDKMPDIENKPYSRARRILDARKKMKVDTKIIQLL